jgi:dTMP kinase
LFSFEGIDGSGKSTQVRLLAEALAARGHTVHLVREPGGTPTSEAIRSLLLDPEAHIAPRAELLLFSAARAQLVEEAIRPALERGDVVIADRFFDSTTAYQGGGRGLADPGWLDAFHRFVTGGLVPARTYLVDVPLEVAAMRRGADASRDGADRMEAGGEAFFGRVREAYRHLAAVDPGRVLTVDGTRPAADLHHDIVADALRHLGDAP